MGIKGAHTVLKICWRPCRQRAPAVRPPSSTDTVQQCISGLVHCSRGCRAGGAEGVDVKNRLQCCRAGLSVPGSAVQTVCLVQVALDSGAGINIMSGTVVTQLQNAFSDMSVATPMTRAHPVRLVGGNVKIMPFKTCLVRPTLRTTWWPMVLERCQECDHARRR